MSQSCAQAGAIILDSSPEDPCVSSSVPSPTLSLFTYSVYLTGLDPAQMPPLSSPAYERNACGQHWPD